MCAFCMTQSAFNSCTNLSSVYYTGTPEEWSAITIGDYNDSLTSATVYFYSETEPTLNVDGTGYDGNYWHYDKNGEPAIWTLTTTESFQHSNFTFFSFFF